eukprot:TRINITY_DN4434_c0_g1_i1.p1 TRINITY_DN4434_c0_g1~~TRINITY_DN4434_c0_g1_i1.p1  ORF type:complete len:497 (+),score=95.69 TRINITY_DN4434_c0_g1_i1:148-1638(+)
MNLITAVLLLVVFSLLLVVLYFKRNFSTLNHVPGDGFSIKAMFEFISSETGEIFMVWLSKYGPVFKYYFLLTPRVLVSDPDMVKHILITNQKNYTKNIFTYKSLGTVIGNGLVSVVDKDEHSEMRGIIQEAFSYSNLKLYFHIFIQKGLLLMKRWEQHSKSKGPVLVVDDLFACTLDIIGRAAFGQEFNTLKSNNKNERSLETPIPDLVEQVMDKLHNQSFLDLFWITRKFTKRTRLQNEASRHLYQEMSKVIHEKQEKNNQKGDSDTDENRDLLDILVSLRDENGQPLSEESITEHSKTFLFAGHETLQSSFLWILYLLSRHPEVHAKLTNEIRETLGGNGSEVKIPKIEDLDSLKYLNCVVKESLRVFPPVPLVLRKCETTETVNGVLIPGGTIVVVSMYVQHHNPDYWENAEEFRPERWADDPKVHPGLYLPFLIGSRNCIGNRFALLEIKAILALILQKFKVRFPEDHPPVQRRSRITMKPVPYLKLFIEPV